MRSLRLALLIENKRKIIIFILFTSLLLCWFSGEVLTMSSASYTAEENRNETKAVKGVSLPWWDGGTCSTSNETASESTIDNMPSWVGGTCGRRAWQLGDGEKIVSFSLYGWDPDYWEGLGDVIASIKKFYPGWIARIYTDPSGRKEHLCHLLQQYEILHVCNVVDLPRPLGNISSIHPMMWRVAPLGDPLVSVMAVRDTDSPILKREADAVTEWLKSSKSLHTMRDHPQHGARILGGLWGIKMKYGSHSKLQKIRGRMFLRANGLTAKNEDQQILTKTLWPNYVRDVVAHDSYFCTYFIRTQPWPTQRENGSFVGQPSYRRIYQNNTIHTECPKKCRPKNHLDWTYC